MENWNNFILPILFAYYTSVVKTIGIASDLLTYERSLCLLAKVNKREDIWDRLKHMIIQVPIFK